MYLPAAGSEQFLVGRSSTSARGHRSTALNSPSPSSWTPTAVLSVFWCGTSGQLGPPATTQVGLFHNLAHALDISEGSTPLPLSAGGTLLPCCSHHYLNNACSSAEPRGLRQLGSNSPCTSRWGLMAAVSPTVAWVLSSPMVSVRSAEPSAGVSSSCSPLGIGCRCVRLSCLAIACHLFSLAHSLAPLITQLTVLGLSRGGMAAMKLTQMLSSIDPSDLRASPALLIILRSVFRKLICATRLCELSHRHEHLSL